MPAAFVERGTAAKLFVDRTQLALEYGERQTQAGLAIGFDGTVHRCQAGHMRTMATQDLQHK